MQDCYKEIEKVADCPVEFHTEPPTENFQCQKSSLIIFDDLQGCKNTTEVIKDFFIRRSHHDDISVIYICQTLFDKHPAHRVISLNTNYFVIFNSPRDRSELSHLSKQIYPGANNFLSSVASTIVREGGVRGTYLVIDLFPDTEESYRIRNTLFPALDFPNAFAYVRY